MVKEPKYMLFPISMLPDIFDNTKEAFYRILMIGFYMYSKEIDCEIKDVAGQLMNRYIFNQKLLTNNLITYLEEINQTKTTSDREFLLMDKTDCFNQHGEFDLSGMDEILCEKLEENPEIKEEAIRWYSVLQSFKYFNLKFDSIGSKYKTMISIQTDKQVLAMVKLDVILDYYKNTKTENELAQFACFAAIKSIIGMGKNAFTNKEYIVARMFGASSMNSLPETPHQLYSKYIKRNQIDSLLEKLEDGWRLIRITDDGLRGFGVSFKSTYEDLYKFIIGRQQDAKTTERNKLKLEAKLKVKREYFEEQMNARKPQDSLSVMHDVLMTE
jgi:hypothetical protein